MKLKTLIIPIAAFTALTLSSCGNGQSNEQESSAEDTTAAVMETEEEVVEDDGTYGEAITADDAMSPADFLAMMEGKDSLDVKVAGNIKACCKKKGCWMDLDLENGTTMKVRFKDYGFFVPLDSEGNKTIIEGRAYFKEVPVNELKHYAEDGGATQEEIDAITEPEMTYSFIAHGAIIEKI